MFLKDIVSCHNVDLNFLAFTIFKLEHDVTVFFPGKHNGVQTSTVFVPIIIFCYNIKLCSVTDQIVTLSSCLRCYYIQLWASLRLLTGRESNMKSILTFYKCKEREMCVKYVQQKGNHTETNFLRLFRLLPSKPLCAWSTVSLCGHLYKCVHIVVQHPQRKYVPASMYRAQLAVEDVTGLLWMC